MHVKIYATMYELHKYISVPKYVYLHYILSVHLKNPLHVYVLHVGIYILLRKLFVLTFYK